MYPLMKPSFTLIAPCPFEALEARAVALRARLGVVGTGYDEEPGGKVEFVEALQREMNQLHFGYSSQLETYRIDPKTLNSAKPTDPVLELTPVILRVIDSVAMLSTGMTYADPSFGIVSTG